VNLIVLAAPDGVDISAFVSRLHQALEGEMQPEQMVVVSASSLLAQAQGRGVAQLMLLEPPEVAADAVTRALMDALRIQLVTLGASFTCLTDLGDAGVSSAADAIRHALTVERRASEQQGRPRWRWVCDKCDDGDCEQHWLSVHAG